MHEQLICYKKMPIWQKSTLPTPFMEQHNTQAGTWAKLTVIKGSVTFALLTAEGDITETFIFTVDNQPPFIEPQQWHKIVNCSDDVECQLAFYCLPELFSHKKYGMTKTHSDVIDAVKQISPCKALDLGCGSGRNALYLNACGFEVTALDKNSLSINQLNDIIKNDSLQGIQAATYDINDAALTEHYGLIISTVVMMFLQPNRIADIIENMQKQTLRGGYNLVVAAMSTKAYPCHVPFSFTFSENELKQYYKGWQLIKYNENVGQLHRIDENGDRIKLQFATLLARK